MSEVEKAKMKLKNGKAPGPDEITGEEIKAANPVDITDKLNQLMIKKDSTLTEGFLVPIEKPGKDPGKPDSYRPVILLSAYRKLLSQIVLDRINPILESSLSSSQFAYRTNRSTGDIVLGHKYLLAGAIAKGLTMYCTGIDMSKAFDNVIRSKLLEILAERGVPIHDITIIKLLLTNTHLQVKDGKDVGDLFETNKGVPQGDGLSPKLFTIYLDEALREIDRKLDSDHQGYQKKGTATTLQGHDYFKNARIELPRHLEYADDVDFFTTSEEDANKIEKVAAEVLQKYNLKVNPEKTEIFKYHKDTDLRKVRKLGTVLDELAEINRRKHLSQLAMSKYKKIWKNRFINTKKKVKIYNVYVRSILLYNCSTWTSNKSTANKLDAFHRKQLRRVINIRYPKIIKNEDLYKITSQKRISEHILERRKAHLGHILRRNHPIRGILHHIKTLPPKGRAPANILKTYEEDLGTDNLQTWTTRALAKRL